jgi:putative transposase
VKRSLVVEADGGPLGAAIAGANVHDTKLLAATLESIVVERPQPTAATPQHLCLDKGYDNPTGHETVAAYQYIPHIRRIGEEKLDPHGQKTYPARRWVVERTLAWLSKCRGLLVRSAMRRKPSISWGCYNWPVPCCGCGAGHGSLVIVIVSKRPRKRQSYIYAFSYF